MKILQNFVAFSEYMNFNGTRMLVNECHLRELQMKFRKIFLEKIEKKMINTLITIGMVEVTLAQEILIVIPGSKNCLS